MNRVAILIPCTVTLMAIAPNTAVAAESFCEVAITGDESATFRESGDDPPAGAYVSGENLGKKLTPAEMDKKVAVKMAADPRATALNVGCGNNDVSISVMASPKSKYATVPQKAGKYRIVTEKQEKPGDFSLLFMKGSTIYQLASPGSIEVTKFDDSGVAGKFSFEAVSLGPKTKRVKVTATFSYRCKGHGRCKR